MNGGTGTHRVVVFEAGPRLLVRPASVIVRPGDVVTITNYSGWSDMVVLVPPGHPLRVTGGGPAPATLEILSTEERGVFPYQVYLSDGAGRREFAEGESAPRVIIDY